MKLTEKPNLTDIEKLCILMAAVLRRYEESFEDTFYLDGRTDDFPDWLHTNYPNLNVLKDYPDENNPDREVEMMYYLPYPNTIESVGIDLLMAWSDYLLKTDKIHLIEGIIRGYYEEILEDLDDKEDIWCDELGDISKGNYKKLFKDIFGKTL